MHHQTAISEEGFSRAAEETGEMQKQRSGMITEVRKFSTHDGPGIRTTIFLKGCPLRCFWCSNPETLTSNPELYVRAQRCKGSGNCISACPRSAISRSESVVIERNKCDLCGGCVAECPNRVFQQVGEVAGVNQVMEQIRKDRPFYRSSGGATLCGGEPLFQPEFTLALLAACRNEDIGTVLDTSGFAPTVVVEKAAGLTDLVLLDIKHMDSTAHRQGTGVDNQLILENARHIARLTTVRISLPLIPDFNDSEENLRRTAEFARDIGVQAIDVNPMHILGSEKYRALGKKVPYEGFGPMDMTKARSLANVVRSFGIEVTIGRMM